MEEEIVVRINAHTKAINTLSKRIDEKIDAKELRKLFKELSSEIESYKKEIAQLTTGLVDFFTETMLKNTQSNESVERATELNSKLILTLNSILARLKIEEETLKQNKGEEIEWL